MEKLYYEKEFVKYAQNSKERLGELLNPFWMEILDPP